MNSSTKAPSQKAQPAKRVPPPSSAARTKAPAQDDDAFFSEENSVRVNYFKFENIGDRVKGVYVGNYVSTSSKYGYRQENYILVLDDGSQVAVSGRSARKEDGVKIIYGMERIPLGAVMGFIYTGDKDTGKGNPCKLIDPRYGGQKRPDILAKFQERYSVDAIAKAAEQAAGTATDESAETDSDVDPALPSFGQDE